MIYKAIYSICFSLTFLAPAAAQALTLCGKSAQGEVLTAYAPGAVKVELNGKSYPVTPDGKFIFAFGRDEASSAKLTVSYSDGRTQDYSLTVAPSRWDIQNLKGVQPRKVTPKPADQKAIDRERTDVRKALTRQTENIYWQKKFIRPLKGRISGNFGGQRIMNGKKMNPHQGTDIACPIARRLKRRLTVSSHSPAALIFIPAIWSFWNTDITSPPSTLISTKSMSKRETR